jgi:carboxyl-terminal processing protease
LLRPSSSRIPGKYLSGLAILVGLIFFPQLLRAEEPARLVLAPSWRDRALAAEKRGAWLQACRCYDEVLRKDRNNSFARDGYLRCLRRLHLVARHSDPLYRQTLARLKQDNALVTYEQVLAAVAYHYADRSRTDLTQLFQQGVVEARLALDDPVFRQHYLRNLKPGALDTFRARLAGLSTRKITRTAEARELLWGILRQASRDGLPTRSVFGSALVMEFAAGACNGLDEYSSFLSPGILAGAPQGPRARVGVGLEVALNNDRLQVTRVYPKSPALGRLLPGDQVLRISGESVDGLPGDAAAEKLLGEPGSVVVIEFSRGGNKQTARLKRQAVTLPAVEYDPQPRLLDDTIPVGYLRINYFADDTLQEVRDILLRASSMGSMNEPIRGLILDLRGNPGGVFTSAVAIAELFLSGGVVVIGQSHTPEYNRTYKSESSAPFAFPIVVLIDGDTASSAEVLAAALRDSRGSLTRLIGQPSFGKGSLQCPILLKKAPLDRLAGIRLTVAKLFSPSNQPLTKGVAPDTPVKPEDDILAVAEKELKRLILGETGPVPGAVAMAPPKAPSMQ